MKLYSKLLMLATIPAALLAGGCDDVKEGPGRYQHVGLIESERRVLVFDFTGQSCTNCPVGAQTIQEIHDSYPANIVAVGLSPFGNPNTEPPTAKDFGLRSEEATVMYKYYNPDGFPCAVFDGTSMDQGSFAVWNQMFRQALLVAPQADITTVLKYDEESRNLKVQYTVEYLDNVGGASNIQLWITEDNIVAPQKLANGSVYPRYVHNHLLRASMAGDWGDELGSGHKAGEVVHGEAEIVLDANWNAENCNVVAFVQLQSDKSVLQALQTPIYEKEETHE